MTSSASACSNNIIGILPAYYQLLAQNYCTFYIILTLNGWHSFHIDKLHELKIMPELCAVQIFIFLKKCGKQIIYSEMLRREDFLEKVFKRDFIKHVNICYFYKALQG